MFSFGDHGKERIESNHAIHFLYGYVQFAGDDTLHLFRLVPMLVANLSVFFMIACNLQVGRIFMGIRISVLQRSENVRVDKGRVENMKKRSPVRLVVNGPGFTINLSTIYSQWELLCLHRTFRIVRQGVWRSCWLYCWQLSHHLQNSDAKRILPSVRKKTSTLCVRNH